MDIMTPRKWDQGPKRKCTNGPHGILIGFFQNAYQTAIFGSNGSRILNHKVFIMPS